MRVVSLFSGAGGLDLGFIWAGHEIIWANDVDGDAVATYKANIGKHVISGPIELIPSSSIPDCDIVIGGFPCQGFSVANMNRSLEDSRNKMYLELLRIVKEKRPKYFLAENVKGLTSLDKGRVLEMILRDFGSAGYQVKHKVLDAVDYGVPQHRQRVIFIGSRNDIAHAVSFPAPTHADPASNPVSPLQPWVSIGEALNGIPEPEEAPELPNHTYSRYKLRFVGYLGHRRVDPDKPAPTVTARGDDRGGVVVLHHPKNHRRMSARELAATQSFPLDFVFSGTQSSAYRQIGNAVPPVFAKALASVFPHDGTNQ
jgi:DNA (cytosine-5)-methyltransferase 1